MKREKEKDRERGREGKRERERERAKPEYAGKGEGENFRGEKVARSIWVTLFITSLYRKKERNEKGKYKRNDK